VKNDSKILVFIPMYRCSSQIKRVINQFTPNIQNLVHTVVAIDNISPDNTLEVAIEEGKKVFTNCNFIAWKNDDNFGLGGSHKAAFRYAIENNFDYLIVLHGDDQANIADIAPYLEDGGKEFQDLDCFLGSRFMRKSTLKGYSLIRTIGNHVYNILFSIVARKRIHDLGSGLNLYKLNSFKNFYYKGFPDDLTFNYVMLLSSYHLKHKISYFPITWRDDDQVSNVRLVHQGIKVLKFLANFFLKPKSFLNKDLRTKKIESYSGQIVHKHELRVSG